MTPPDVPASALPRGGAAEGAPDLVGPVVPQAAARSDRVLPILIVASLVVHATVMLPSLLGAGAPPPEPQHEIPIEIVQLPPKPPEKPKVAVKPAPEKPKVAAKPAVPDKPKVAAKAPPPKPVPKPQQVAQRPHPKPRPSKVAERPKPTPQPAKVIPVSGSERLKDLLGPMPAIALPGSSDSGTENVSYSQLVLSKVAKAKKEGHFAGVPGSAGVTFTLGDSGEVATVSIVRPSGDPSLDAEAIAMIRRGAPYPPPPPGGRRDYSITLRFQPLI